VTDSRANGGFPGLRNLTTTSLVLVVLVGASVLGEAALICAQISSTEAHDLGAALSVTKFLIPHLLALALLTTGFRVAGDVAALVSSAIILLLASLEAGIGRAETPSIAANASYLALLQVAILICALSDLGQSRKLHPQPGSAHHSINGLRIPIVTLLFAWGVVALNFSAANRRTGAQKAAYKAELEQVALAWARRSSLVPLLRIAQCIERFRGDTIAGPYPRSLPQLYRWSLASTRPSDRCGAGLYSGPTDTLAPALGEDTHYVLYYTPPARLQGEPFLAEGFTLEVNAVWDSMKSPLAAGKPGTRNFFLDSAGAIHMSSEHRRATARDPLLRTCRPGEVDPYVQVDCNPYQPRQRWGVKPDLPHLSVGMYNTARVHKEAYGQLEFYQASGLDSAATLVVDWSDGSKPMTVVIPRSQALGANNNMYGSFLKHIYSDAGWKFVHATIRTRAGAEYQAQDSILIELK